MYKKKSLKILVVDDKYEYAYNAAKYLLGKGHKPMFAFDLEDALKIMEEDKPDIVLTDYCFHEKGIRYSKEPKGYDSLEKFKLKKANVGIKKILSKPFSSALKKTKKEVIGKMTYYKPINSDAKIEELVEICLKNLDKKFMKKVIYSTDKRSKYYYSVNDVTQEDVGYFKKLIKNKEHLSWWAPMGYYLVQEAKKQKIPVKVVTNLGRHGEHCIPLLAANKLEEQDEVLKVYDAIINSEEYYKGGYNPAPVMLKSGNVVVSSKKSEKAWGLALKSALKELK